MPRVPNYLSSQVEFDCPSTQIPQSSKYPECLECWSPQVSLDCPSVQVPCVPRCP